MNCLLLLKENHPISYFLNSYRILLSPNSPLKPDSVDSGQWSKRRGIKSLVFHWSYYPPAKHLGNFPWPAGWRPHSSVWHSASSVPNSTERLFHPSLSLLSCTKRTPFSYLPYSSEHLDLILFGTLLPVWSCINSFLAYIFFINMYTHGTKFKGTKSVKASPTIRCLQAEEPGKLVVEFIPTLQVSELGRPLV